MTRYGVPDDDMPERLSPPTWASAADERDLDTLLSGAARGLTGEEHGIPDPLRPVARTLAALLAAPAPGEPADEAAARAVFRACTPVPAPGSWATEAEPGTVYARTEIFSPGDGGQWPAARHRRRPGSWAARWPAAVAAGVAAVIVIVLTVTLTGGIGGSIAPAGNPGARPAGAGASATSTAQSPSIQRVAGQGSTVRVAGPPAVASTAAPVRQDPAKLCREGAYVYFYHPDPPGIGAITATLWARLTALAGGSSKVWKFCYPYLASLLPQPRPGTAPSPGPSVSPSPPSSTTPSPGPSAPSSPGPGTTPSPGPGKTLGPGPSVASSPQPSLG